ncbi:LRRC4C [Branchiostoma lanceolatum]|uniref:LRRC4C protein n=1 Tax=Branchiostoma lanceolatum TaxID=7740 RepID=A0A8J9ZFL8_BRALA|nr:LRRC4C [Branchiostoma lanceolatum]
MLKDLSLKHNFLRHVRSDWFYGLTHLSGLNLFSNRLETLPKDAFVYLTELKQLDMRKNDLMSLPKEFRWPQKRPVFMDIAGKGLRGVYDRTVGWTATLSSDLSFVQLRVTRLNTRPSLGSYFIQSQKRLIYVTHTEDATRTTSYDYGYKKARHIRGRIMKSQNYPCPFLIIAVMEGEDTKPEDTLNQWCKRFWSGEDTASTNLGASKGTTLQLAAIVTKKNNRTVRLFSVLFDPTSSAEEKSPYNSNRTQVDSTPAEEGTRAVKCVLVSGEKTFEFSFLPKKREQSDTTTVHYNTTSTVRYNTSEQGRDNTTYVVFRESSTAFIPPADVHEELTPTLMDITITMRPDQNQDQPTISAGKMFMISAATFLGLVVVTYIVSMLGKTPCPSRRHGDQDATDDPNTYCEITDVTTTTATQVFNTRAGQAQTAVTAEDDMPTYSEIPTEYFSFNNPGYRRASLPTEDHVYWQIPDKYYRYQNTWPSSLPLSFDVTYENVQYENVGRWQRQPSDNNVQDAEVSPPSVSRSGTMHPHYVNHTDMSKSPDYTTMTGEVEKEADVIAHGRPKATNLKSRDMIRRGAYGTKRRSAGVAWRIRPQDEDNPSYGPADQVVARNRRADVNQPPRGAPVSRSTDEVLKTYPEWGGVPVHKSLSQEIPLSEERTTGTGRMTLRPRYSL